MKKAVFILFTVILTGSCSLAYSHGLHAINMSSVDIFHWLAHIDLGLLLLSGLLLSIILFFTYLFKLYTDES